MGYNYASSEIICYQGMFDFSILVSSYAGKVINLRRLDNVISSINNWYMERGLIAVVSSLASSFIIIIFHISPSLDLICIKPKIVLLCDKL